MEVTSQEKAVLSFFFEDAPSNSAISLLFSVSRSKAAIVGSKASVAKNGAEAESGAVGG